jgi:type I restriction enzyme S subunit
VEYGEILLLWDGANAGEFIQAKYGVISSTIAHIVFIKDINKKYAWYYSKFLEQQLRKTTIGMGIPHVSGNELNNLIFCEPSIFEQKTIANFLDRETTHIDSLIKEKENFISLLKEKRQALISHAVTKGLDPTVKMKDSGVEWLGDVPEHWSHLPLKWISKIFSGGTPDKKITEYWENGVIPWINSGAVNNDLINQPTTYITEEAFINSSAKWIKNGSLVMALAGQGKTKGMATQLNIDTTCNQSMAAIEVNHNYNARFLYWWLKSNYQNIRNLSGGDSRDGLNLEIIGLIRCPFFDSEEKKQIADFLDKQPTKIDALVKETKNSIELLKEHRTALISAAVTGKIDVRNFEKEVA